MADIDWGQAADLTCWQGEPPRTSISPGGKVSGGTLAEVVKLVMAEPHAERWRYDVYAGGETYDATEIEEIAARADYPYRRG